MNWKIKIKKTQDIIAEMLGIQKAQPIKKDQTTLSKMPGHIIYQHTERSNYEKTGHEKSKRPQSVHADSKLSKKNQCKT